MLVARPARFPAAGAEGRAGSTPGQVKAILTALHLHWKEPKIVLINPLAVPHLLRLYPLSKDQGTTDRDVLEDIAPVHIGSRRTRMVTAEHRERLAFVLSDDRLHGQRVPLDRLQLSIYLFLQGSEVSAEVGGSRLGGGSPLQWLSEAHQ